MPYGRQKSGVKVHEESKIGASEIRGVRDQVGGQGSKFGRQGSGRQRSRASKEMNPNKWTKILSLEMTIFGLKMMVKSGLEKIILKFHVPLQSCCCPVQKNLPRMAELAWLVSRYL